MNDTAKQGGGKVEPYDYASDFQFLTPKEKRGVLKSAKHFLKLQKETSALLADAGSHKKAKAARRECFEKTFHDKVEVLNMSAATLTPQRSFL